MNIRCHIWDLTVYINDSIGKPLTPNSTQFSIIYPNSTNTELSGANVFYIKVMNGTFNFVVKWQNNWVYGRSSAKLDVDTQSLQLQTRVSPLLLVFRENMSLFAIKPLQITIQNPNGTLFSLSDTYLSQAQNGTWTIKRILLQDNRTARATNPSQIINSNYIWMVTFNRSQDESVFYDLTRMFHVMASLFLIGLICVTVFFLIRLRK